MLWSLNYHTRVWQTSHLLKKNLELLYSYANVFVYQSVTKNVVTAHTNLFSICFNSCKVLYSHNNKCIPLVRNEGILECLSESFVHLHAVWCTVGLTHLSNLTWGLIQTIHSQKLPSTLCSTCFWCPSCYWTCLLALWLSCSKNTEWNLLERQS